MAKPSSETPLMKQFNQIKVKYPGALLLFRVGDFYETFGEDAIRASTGNWLTTSSMCARWPEKPNCPVQSLTYYMGNWHSIYL